MHKYHFNFTSDEIPKYIQISNHIKNMIDTNLISDGERLPSIRELSNILGVNTVTVVNAYKKLQEEGSAVLKIGSGTYAKKREISKNFKKMYSDIFKRLTPEKLKDYIDFTGESSNNSFFPVASFKDVLDEVLVRDGAEALAYQETIGFNGLRKNINRFFWNNSQDVDSILIVSGAQQGIDIISKVLININDNIVIEKPTYSGAISVFKGRHANIFDVDMEDDGVNLESLEAILKKNRIKCFYTMSYFQNPTGMTYSMDKKLAILKMAEKYDFYIIEDDYLSELIYDSDIKYNSFKSLDTFDRVIYIKSFSKIFLPGIRLGYTISPAKFKEQIQNSKIDTDISTSSLMQRALDLYICKGYWVSYIENLNNIYKERYYYFTSLLDKFLADKVTYRKTGGGLNLYLKISDRFNINCIELFERCKHDKVLITPGVLFYKFPEEGYNYFRLSFSLASEESMEYGLKVINSILI